jgi:C4-dicarboxylate-specific signal transduction histidine kinase
MSRRWVPNMAPLGAGEVTPMREEGSDVLERKRTDTELAHANRIATMGQLTGSIAHEVKQPIAATCMNAETAGRLLARQPPDLEKAKQLIDRIIKDGNRAADILGRVCEFSKKGLTGKGELEINEAILEVVGLVRCEMSVNGVAARMQLADGVPHIVGDKVQLQQVILNLIINGIEAMSEVREGLRELLISTCNTGTGGVIVAISDSGPGLPDAGSERIFDSTAPGGLGMGLSICRSIVEAHGGRLWVAPNEPHGAVFCMMLPIGEESIECPKASGL